MYRFLTLTLESWGADDKKTTCHQFFLETSSLFHLDLLKVVVKITKYFPKDGLMVIYHGRNGRITLNKQKVHNTQNQPGLWNFPVLHTK